MHTATDDKHRNMYTRTKTYTHSVRPTCVNVVVVVKSKFSHRNYFADNKRLVGKGSKGGNPIGEANRKKKPGTEARNSNLQCEAKACGPAAGGRLRVGTARRG